MVCFLAWKPSRHIPVSTQYLKKWNEFYYIYQYFIYSMQKKHIRFLYSNIHFFRNFPLIYCFAVHLCIIYPIEYCNEIVNHFISAETESHEGKRKVESLWPIFRIHHQRSRYIYDLFYRRKAISRGKIFLSIVYSLFFLR